MNAPEFLVGVVAGVLAVALLHVLFAHQEVYFAWLVPVFLVGIPIAMFTYGGSPMAAGALTGLAAGACVFGRRSVLLSRGHQVRLETLARELGLSFAREDQTFADAAMWIADDVGRGSNVLSGPWHGTPVAVFQYTYLDTSDGEAPAAIQLTCAASILDADLPRMLVRPPRLRESIGRFLHRDRSATADAFDRAFRIEAPDPERARAALPPRARDWLVANARGGRLAVSGHMIVLTTGRSRAEHLPRVLDRIVELRATFR